MRSNASGQSLLRKAVSLLSQSFLTYRLHHVPPECGRRGGQCGREWHRRSWSIQRAEPSSTKKPSIVTAIHGRSELLDASGGLGSFGGRNRDGDPLLNNAVDRNCFTPARDQHENKGECKASKCPHSPPAWREPLEPADMQRRANDGLRKG